MIGTDQKAAFTCFQPIFLKTGIFKVAAFSGFQINKTVFFRRNLLPLNLFLMMRYIKTLNRIIGCMGRRCFHQAEIDHGDRDHSDQYAQPNQERFMNSVRRLIYLHIQSLSLFTFASYLLSTEKDNSVSNLGIFRNMPENIGRNILDVASTVQGYMESIL